MPSISMTPQQRGRIGGLTRAALTPDNRDITKPMRDGRWERYRQRILDVLPELAGDDAEIDRRAALLRQADMIRMSAAAAAKRRELAELEAELDVTGLGDAGNA
jgi:hypothetical protein